MSKQIQSSTYKQKTGKTLEQWIVELDRHNAKAWTHKEVVAHLQTDHQVDGWWAQTITVEYEFHHGKRVLGQTQDAGFEVGVQRTLSIEQTELWELLLSSQGAEMWLGEPIEIPTNKGATFIAGGSEYEIISIVVGKKLRLRKLPEKEPTSTIQMYLIPKQDKTALLIHHEKLISAEQRAEMKHHWQEKLAELKSYITKETL